MSSRRFAAASAAIRRAMPSVTLATALALEVLGSPAPARADVAGTCDFDADGKGDLAVGVPGEDYNRGAVNVQYNQGGFLAKSVLLQAQHPDGDKVLERAHFGAALACGDFNGDGVGDLAVGGPRTPTGGNVWLFWGKKGLGLDASFYWVFHQTNGTIPGSPKGSFGHALAAGDFNGDRVDDLAVGDPDEPIPGVAYGSGTVLVVPGKKGGLTFEGVQQLWGWTVAEGESVNQFGWSLAAAPLVSGGGEDLVVGAPHAKVTTKHLQAGRVYLFRDHGGLVPHQAIDEAAIGAAGGLPSLHAKSQAYAWFGRAVATGDFNADGKVDLAVGIPGKSVPGQAYAGAATILPGNGVGLNLVGHTYVFQEAVGGATEAGDRYGWALTAGNWNGDQHDDLAVGAPFEDVGGAHGEPSVDQAGAVFVHYGGPSLVSGAGQVKHQGKGAIPGVPEARDWFGHSLASVRMGQGNGAYLVIGIPGEKAAGVKAECGLAGAVQLGVSWPGVGPLADPNFLLHQDTKDPFNVADQRECTGATTPWLMNFADGVFETGYGELFGWAVGS